MFVLSDYVGVGYSDFEVNRIGDRVVDSIPLVWTIVTAVALGPRLSFQLLIVSPLFLLPPRPLHMFGLSRIDLVPMHLRLVFQLLLSFP